MRGSPGTPPPDPLGGPRAALIVATMSHDDQALRRLRAPGRDAAALAETLADPDIGGFAVTSVTDRPMWEIRLAVQDFLHDRGTRDLVLVYLSCHGLLDEYRRLYFAATDTRKDRLAATAVEAAWLMDLMEHCRARRQILILDACFSGAFAHRAKAGGTALDLEHRLLGPGRGRVVLTASTATEYSFEGRPGAAAGTTGSVFTTALVDGLRTGAADLDGDGLISVDEAYHFAFDQVQASGSPQTPQRWLYGAEGHIVLARSPAGPRTGTAPPQSPVRRPGRRRAAFSLAAAGAVAVATVIAWSVTGLPGTAPTPTPSATPNPYNTRDHTIRWELLPEAPPVTGHVKYTIDFTRSATGWTTGRAGIGTVSRSADGLTVHPTQNKQIFILPVPGPPPGTRAEHMSSVVRFNSGQGAWGLWCRGSERAGGARYRFVMSHTGSVAIFAGGGYDDTTQWWALKGIDLDRPIALRASCMDVSESGPVRLEFAVNGRTVLTHRPRTLIGPGYSGLEAWAFLDVAGPTADVTFTSLEITGS
ncbi:caspase family protein [Sphaerisporangium aureirubrum]|uniref:Caspase domain-containing protein n=1 Tax=Sphaerisporangium aureirubrum TaxID=1544736 RepID=A0ABW1NGY2_9ACTN